MSSRQLRSKLPFCTFVFLLMLAMFDGLSTLTSTTPAKSSTIGFQGQYQLLDYGNGLRLEQFGKYRVRRPCVAALESKPTLSKSEWEAADITYKTREDNRGVSSGVWEYRDHVVRDGEKNVTDWTVSCGDHMHFVLNTYEGGQVGIFPEQLETWKWVEKRIQDYLSYKGLFPNQKSKKNDDNDSQPSLFRVLNGFAYTGGSTMACLVDPIVQVTNLDAAKVSIKLAKQNIGLLPTVTEQSVRWIADDCMTFVGRETKRIANANQAVTSTSISSIKNSVMSSSSSSSGTKSASTNNAAGYHGLIFDPPAFGRDSKGNIWKIEKGMPLLLEALPSLLHQYPSFFVVSCHDKQWPAKRLATEMQRYLNPFLRQKGTLEANNLYIPQANSSRRLHFGSYVRWTRKLL